MIWMLLPCMHSVPGPLCLHVNTNVFTNQLFIRSSWESQHRHWTVKDVSHDQLIGATKPGKLFVSYSAATQQSFISLESKYDSIILNRPQLYLCHSWLPVICWKGRAKQSKSLIRQTLKNPPKKIKNVHVHKMTDCNVFIKQKAQWRKWLGSHSKWLPCLFGWGSISVLLLLLPFVLIKSFKLAYDVAQWQVLTWD